MRQPAVTYTATLYLSYPYASSRMPLLPLSSCHGRGHSAQQAGRLANVHTVRTGRVVFLDSVHHGNLGSGTAVLWCR